MAKKPRGHSIKTLSDAYLSKLFHDWNCNEYDHDYGIDYLVEIFHNTISSGLIFGVQNKSTDDIGKCNNGSYTFSMKTDHLKDYLMQPFPVFLHLYDTPKEQGYWLNLYLYCNDVLNKEKPLWREQKYVTCYIPKENKLELLEEITDSVILSRLRYIGKNSDSLEPIRKINYHKVIKWTKKSERFDKIPPLLPKVFSHVINLHYPRHLYRIPSSVFFPKSEDGLFIQHIHDFTSVFKLYKKAPTDKKKEYMSKLETYAKQHNLKLERFYHKDFQVIGFTSSILFENLTEAKFEQELKRIQNGIFFMVVYFTSFFVDLAGYTLKVMDIAQSLNYISERDSGQFKIITLKNDGVSIPPTHCLIDSEFGSIHLKHEQKHLVFGIKGDGFNSDDLFNKFSQDIKQISDKYEITVMVYQSPSKLTKFDKYLNIHLVHRIPLDKIEKAYINKKKLNMSKAAEASLKLFKEFNFPSRNNMEALAQHLEKNKEQ